MYRPSIVVVASGAPGTPVVCWARAVVAVNNQTTINAAPSDTFRRVRCLVFTPSYLPLYLVHDRISPLSELPTAPSGTSAALDFGSLATSVFASAPTESLVLHRTKRHKYAQWFSHNQSDVIRARVELRASWESKSSYPLLAASRSNRRLRCLRHTMRGCLWHAATHILSTGRSRWT
jgi:hypothetical protein